MKFFSQGRRKKALLLGGIALVLTAVVAVCFCCVRIETPQQRQQRLASEAGITSSWSTASAKAQVEPAPAGTEPEEEPAAQEESASSASAAAETSSRAEASSGQAQTSGTTQTSRPPGTSASATPSQPPAASGADSQPETPQSNTGTVSISCKTALPYAGDLGLSLPEDGMLLENARWEFTGSATVWDIVEGVCRAQGIKLDTTENPLTGVYIHAIAKLAEKACGPTSGWVYYLNGQFSSQGISQQTLQDGDSIQFAYTVIPGDSVPQ